MRTLIVGGTSSLARALIPALSKLSDVITAGREGCDVRLDLRDPVADFRLPENVDVVVNAAADFGGKLSADMLRAEDVNVLGVLKLCQSCVDANVKHVVLISSIFACLDKVSAIYGIYALSKKHSDEVAELYGSAFGLPIAILRPSQFYGVGDAYRKHQPFLYSIMDKAARGEDIVIYGSNDALRNFIHVEDVANVVAAIVERRLTGTFECTHPRNVAYTEVATAAIAAFRSRSAIRFLRDKPDIPDNIFKHDESLYRLIDYWPQISISDGMQKEAAFRNRTQ